MKNSRTNSLVNSQNLFGDAKSKGTTIKRAGFTRWLSHGNAVNSIRKNYQAILNDLENAVAVGESSTLTGPTATGLLKHFQNYDFFSIIHFMCDVLNVLDHLNLWLQQNYADLSLIQIKVQGTIHDLKKLQKKPGGPFCKKLEERARQLSINAPVGDTNTSYEKDARSFLTFLIENIEERLEDQSIITTLAILDLRKANSGTF